MKFLIKLFMAISAIIFAVVTVIKIVQGCSYKEAVGIAEEMWNEIRENCTCYCSGVDIENESQEKE